MRSSIPTMPALPLVGNSLTMMFNPEGFFVDAYEKFGPIFRVKLGLQKYTVLAGEEARKWFMAWHEKGLSRDAFYGRFGKELGSDFFILAAPQGGGRHTQLRKMMKLGFSREAASPYVPRMVQAVREMALSWAPGTDVPVMDAMARLTFQLYGFVMADRDLTAAFGDAHTYAQTMMMQGAKVTPPVFYMDPRYQRAKQRVLELMQELLEETKTHRTPDLTILAALRQAIDAPGEMPITEKDVLSSALYGFVGTIVYMCRAVSFLVYELSRNPACLARVMKEADSAFANGDPDGETLRRMTYLRAAFNESLRMHPIAIGLPFMTDEDIQFEGHTIPKGDMILISHVPGHFSPKTYSDPWKFDPDRFLEPRNEHRKAQGAFLPYGFGGRSCTAVGLTETLVLVTLATLARTVRFEINPPSYKLTTWLYPLPGPEPAFRVRITEHRAPPVAVTALPAADETHIGGLTAPEAARVESMITGMQVRALAAGTTVIREGDRAEDFYIVAEGEVAVLRRVDGVDQPLARLGPGDFFGERGLLTGSPRNATVRCDSAVKLLVISREAFLAIVTDGDLMSSDIARFAKRRYAALRLSEAMPKLDVSLVDQFSSEFQLEILTPGQVIVREGDLAETFHIVASGQVEVVREGTDTILTRLGPGEYFGEMGLLLRRPRTATVRAGPQGARVMTLGREAFARMMGSSETSKDQVVLKVLERMSGLLS